MADAANSKAIAKLEDRCAPLKHLSRLARSLATASTFSEVFDVRNRAEVLRKLAETVRASLDLQNQAAELRLRAERQMGEQLAQLKLRGGDRRSKASSSLLKLSDLGISRFQSGQWQRIARIPESEFEKYLSEMKDAQKEISASGLLRSFEELSSKPARRTIEPSQHPKRQLSFQILEIQHHVDEISQALTPNEETGIVQLELPVARTLLRRLREVREMLDDIDHSQQ